jgi:glycerol-3-phosphate acyltransferase PlsY
MAPEAIYAAACVISYLLGAIPFGYILVRIRTGKDVRTMGSGNIGATNVARNLGAAWFVPVFALDFLKGFAPVFWLAPWVAARWRCPTCPAPMVTLAVFCGLFSLVGHMWPVTLGFRGGKGVATMVGVLVAMSWPAALVATVVWVAVFLPFRYVSLGSIAAALSLPVAHHFTSRYVMPRWEEPWIVTIFFAVAGLLVIWRHKENLRRLFQGTERKVGRKDS